MTGAGGDPPAGGGGHAWERLREQRARDLGESTPDPLEPPEEPEPEGERDNEEPQNERAENDQQGK